MPSRRSQLQEDTYFRVLRMLQDNPDLTQRDIAQHLGVSTSGMNYCLNALIDKGWVKLQNFSQSKNKFGYVGLLTPRGGGKAALTSDFLRRKMHGYEALKLEIAILKSEIDTRIVQEMIAIVSFVVLSKDAYCALAGMFL